MSWLNPLNWIKLLTLLKDFWGWASSIYKSLRDAEIKKKQDEKLDEMKKAEDKLSEADSTEDIDKHIEEKSDAACEIEKSLNPDAKC